MTNAAFKQTALRYTVNGAKDLKQVVVTIVVNQHSSGLPGHLLAHKSIYTRWLHRQRQELQVLHIFLYQEENETKKAWESFSFLAFGLLNSNSYILQNCNSFNPSYLSQSHCLPSLSRLVLSHTEPALLD